MKETRSLFRYRQTRKSELGEKCTSRDLYRLTLPLQVLYEINPYITFTMSSMVTVQCLVVLDSCGLTL